MNKLLPVIALASILLCGCAKNSSPEKVLSSFLDKMKEKKFDEAAELATRNSQSAIKEIQDEEAKRRESTKVVPEEVIFEHQKGSNSKKNFELGKAKITGNLATVIVTYTDETKDLPLEYSLKWALEKEDGKWKVMMVPTPKRYTR